MTQKTKSMKDKNYDLYGVLIGAGLGWLINILYGEGLDWRLPIMIIVFMFVGLVIGRELE